MRERERERKDNDVSLAIRYCTGTTCSYSIEICIYLAFSILPIAIFNFRHRIRPHNELNKVYSAPEMR